MLAELMKKGGHRGTTKWKLEEVVAAIKLHKDGHSRGEIAQVLKRSKDALISQVFQDRTHVRGKLACGPVKKLAYVDWKNPDSELVDEETFLIRLYKRFDQQLPKEVSIQEDIHQRVEQYLNREK